MPNVFKIKRGDTLPILDIFLFHNGTPYNAVGSTDHHMFIQMADGAIHRRVMEPVVLASGWFMYEPQDSDWDPAGGGTGVRANPYTSGGWDTSPFRPTERGPKHLMEYEILGPGTTRVTFPDVEEENDILHISPDLADVEA